MLATITKKLGYHFRCFTTDFICKAGGQSLWLKEKAGNCILLYHGIDIRGEQQLNSRFLSQSRLRKQLSYFRQHFNIAQLRDLCDGKIAPNRMNIAITFDDGYQNNIDFALPILEELAIPATFFVTGIVKTSYPMLWPDLIDLAAYLKKDPLQIGDERFTLKKGAYLNTSDFELKALCKLKPWAYKKMLFPALLPLFTSKELADWQIYWQPMSSKTIQSLHAHPLIDIGSHGWFHDDLGVLELSAARERLLKSQNYLYTITGTQPDLLAYPSGSYTPAIRDMAQELGFRYQLAVDYQDPSDGPNRGIFERLTNNPHCSLANQVRAILTGRY